MSAGTMNTGTTGAAQSVQQVLAAVALPEREKRSLLAQALGVAREFLLAHPEATVDADARTRLLQTVQRRLAGEPMAYLLQAQEFYGHRLRVTPDVLIPRPETELLVDLALAALPAERRQARVLDLGTGSGCIAIALAAARPGWTVLGIERSAAALALARDNSRERGVAVLFAAGDWYAPVAGRFDLIVSNPPYVAAGDPHLAQLRYEPRTALTDGGDGLSALRRIIEGAPAHLQAGGRLLVEHGFDQGEAVRAMLHAAGFDAVETARDLEGRERVGGGAWRGAAAAGMAGGGR
jgi:release factor glutamine methyltransferase